MGDRTLSDGRAGVLLYCCSLLLLASLLGIVGCNPQSLSMLLMPFSDNKVDPDYKLFTSNKDVKLVILTEFADRGMLLRPELSPTEVELPIQVAGYMKKRCMENKQKLIVVPQAEVRNFLVKEGFLEECPPLEIGKHFKADYVLNLSVQSLQVVNQKYSPPVYQGKINVFVSLYKVNSKDEEPKVFGKSFSYGYPSDSNILPEVPRNADPSEFRGMFLNRVAREISKLFISYDPDERHILE